MALKEVPESGKELFKYYLKGENAKTKEAKSAHTLGFQDGLAVVEYKSRKTLDKTSLPSVARKDSVDNSKSINVSSLKKIVVKTDPDTKKKFILKNGRRIDIVAQSSSLLQKLLPQELTSKLKAILERPLPLDALHEPTAIPLGEPPPLAALTNPSGKIQNISINKLQIIPKVVTTAPKEVNSPSSPTGNADTDSKNVEKVTIIDNRSGNITNVKIVDNTTCHMLPAMHNPAVIRQMNRSDKALQTEKSLSSQDASTQTENNFSDERDSPLSDQFMKFILSEGDLDQSTRKMIDPMKPKTKEETIKLHFFNDLRKALNFDRSGNLPIHESVLQNDLKALQKNCIILSALRETVNILNQQSYTPLHLAIIHNADVEIVKNLINQGADLRKTDPDGNTAIHLAISNNNLTLLRVLINGIHRNFDFDIHNHDGYTPLILASLIGSYDTAKLLLQHGADPNVKDMKSGRTALFHAAECQQVDIVELLVQNKADPKIRNFFGTSSHDAMFELDDVHVKIKLSILGKDHLKIQQKKKSDSQPTDYKNSKKPKLETTPILKRVTTNDMMKTKKK